MTVASGPNRNAAAAVPEDTAFDSEVSPMDSTVPPYPVIGQIGHRPACHVVPLRRPEAAPTPGESTTGCEGNLQDIEFAAITIVGDEIDMVRTPASFDYPMVSSASCHSGLNDRHAGNTVFVVGAGPQLAAVSPEQLLRLESQPAIAVNKVFYRLRPRYFLSAYIGEVMLAVRRIPNATLLHMRPTVAPPLLSGITSVRRMTFEPGMPLPRRLEAEQPTLLTRMNVALAATHLAYIMGASRIVYIGVEQRNQLHFWHFDEHCRRLIRDDIVSRGNPDILRIDHSYASLTHDLKALDRPAEECMKPFYSVDHTPVFAAYFDILRRDGVDIVATTADSVVADAGARVVGLDAILATQAINGGRPSGTAPR